MNFREMNRRVFTGEPLPQVFFQPRLEPWYDWHRQFDCLPAPYDRMTLLELFDDLGISMRYVDYYTDQPRPIEERYDANVTIHERTEGDHRTRTYETPHGDLTEVLRLTPDQTWRVVDFAVKQPDDLKKLRWLYRHFEITFNTTSFTQGSEFIGDRGVPQFYLPRSPYQALALNWMPYTQFVYALADTPAEIEATFAVIDAQYDRLYAQIIESGLVQIVNFGENLHGHLLPPRVMEHYLLPFYHKRSNQLRDAGIFTHIHIDGAVKPVLRYCDQLPFDGLEAFTPEPQGDVTLDEIAEHVGDKVLLDVIPAVLFAEPYTRDQLMATVERIVELFHPRLVLGVSDEVPEGADKEAVERVRMVAEWSRAHG